MLSLPLIAPQNEYTLFLSPHLRPPSPPANAPHAQARRQTQPQTRTSLAQLQSDELAIATRKHNIRRFGAAWIKPPGVTKTLQAETEERAEREEQEAMQRREQMMMDMQAQQEAEEARNAAAAAAAAAAATAADDGGGEGERDLDDEIPDADDGGDPDEDLDEDEDEDEDEDDEVEGSVEEAENADYGDVTDSDEEDEDDDDDDGDDDAGQEAEGEGEEVEPSFNEESLLENSYMPDDLGQLDEEAQRHEQERYARLEEAELTGVARDQEDLGIERDLDDSVPEAGDYQHTDSELSDTFSEGDTREQGRQSLAERLQQSQGRGELQGRSSFGRDVSSLLESSFVDSSPVLGRLRSATHRANQR